MMMNTDATAKIKPPTGRPFTCVGTAYALRVVDNLEEAAAEAIDDVDKETVADMRHDAGLLRSVVAHRDHLHAQVGDVQETATRFQLAARAATAKYAGAMARMCGAQRDGCPFINGDPMAEEWTDGWDDAEAFACRVRDGQP